MTERKSLPLARSVRRFFFWATLLVAAAALFLLTLLAVLVWPSHDEVARVPGPGGLDVVIAEGNGGATTSFWYDVYVVPRGKSARWSSKVAHLYGAARNESAFGVNARWTDASHVVVEYFSADKAEIVKPSLAVQGQRVSVLLKAGVRDATAPSGGMLDNREHTP